MITIIPDFDPHVIALRVTGEIKSLDYDGLMPKIRTAIEGGATAMFVDAEGFTSMTPDAFVKDLSLGMKNRDEIRRIERIAVVTDAEWVAKMTEAGKQFLPETEFETFAPNDRQKAIEWISMVPALAK